MIGWGGGGGLVYQVLIHFWIDYGSGECMYCSLYDIFSLRARVSAGGGGGVRGQLSLQE